MSRAGKGRPACRRRLKRRPVTVAASALSLDGSKSVLVEDISSDGAKLRGRKLPSVGTEVLVRTEDLEAFGCVAWARFDERGIDFDSPMSRWSRALR